MFSSTSSDFFCKLNVCITFVIVQKRTIVLKFLLQTYNWNNKRVILTSFFWGFGILQVVGAQMGRIYGVKWLLATAMSINCIAFVVIPSVAEVFGSSGVIVCRVIQGLAQGFFFPSIQTLIGQWIPPSERLRSCVLALSGKLRS